MADISTFLDGFNENLLAGHLQVGAGRRVKHTAVAGWMILLSSMAAGVYWAHQAGWDQRAWNDAVSSGRHVMSLWEPAAEAPVVKIAIKPITVREAPVPEQLVESQTAEREQLLERLDRMEAKALEKPPAELEQLRVEADKPRVQKIEVERARLQPEKEAPIIVARPPAPVRQKPKAVEPQVKPVDVRALARDIVQSQPANDQSSLMLFKKREAEPVVEQPIAARPLQVEPTPTVSPPAAAERQPAQAPAPQAPILVVEEGGVRVVGPEGERFIPIGGKLNGKHILATSPKIGLIVTEDSAIRVNNQER